MLIPEVALYNYINHLIGWIRTDLANPSTDTYLYKLFQGNQIGNFNYFNEAKELFIRDKSHPKYLEVRFFFDRERASLPTVHFNLPNESSAYQGIGRGGGVYPGLGLGSPVTNYAEVYRKSYQTAYNLIITGQTSFEVLTIYHTLKNLISTTQEALECNGFYNLQISGGDLEMMGDLVPENVFFRVINLSAVYDCQVPEINTHALIADIQLQDLNVLIN